MKLATPKRFVVYAFLGALTVWPPLHMLLAYEYGISSWKLAGWGMYAEPRLAEHGMEVYGSTTPDGPFEQLRQPSAEVAAAAGAFLENYRWLRRLAPADDFAAAVFADHAHWRHLRIDAYRRVLRRDTGMIEQRMERIEVARATPP